jgi:glyoxylase-like metal-dependent hydrolase (beta-lactamase superfamily II)
MKIYTLPGNLYRLDGGAMFGNAARPVWERWIAPDEINRLPLATRTVLAAAGEAVLLFDAGIGAYLEPKYSERFGVYEPEHVLLRSLESAGFRPEDLTHIFLSHFHFDHVGGVLSAWEEGKEPDLIFPNARYYASQEAWARAIDPHPRDRASFIPLLHRKLEDSGRLELLQGDEVMRFKGLEVRFFANEGHSPGLLAFDLRYETGRLVFASDLIPGKAWVHLPITMGYDRFPERLIDEKRVLLASLAEDGGWLAYVHDPDHAVSRVRYDEEREIYIPVDPRKELVIESP